VTQISARRVALAALIAWRNKKQYADNIIKTALAGSDLPSADRAFALDLFYGVLRNLSLLDFWIADFRKGWIEFELRDVLRIGLYQLFLAKVPEHAAVNETVALVSKRKRSIINAVLRSATRQRHELITKAHAQPVEVRASHPKFLIERWQQQFGPDATERLCEWNNQPPPIYARINQLRTSIDHFGRQHAAAEQVAGQPNFVRLLKAVDLEDALPSGDCYVQAPSTAISCELLAPQTGEKVLDACAAPGGKTSYLAELMQNQGSLVAVDRDADRLEILTQNLARVGASICQVARQDWTKSPIAKKILAAAPFDRILVDAPCSNTGVMRRRVDVRWRLRPADFVRMPQRQIQIVRAVLPLLKPGGVLVYSTCSLEAEENAEVVESLQCELSSLELQEQRCSIPFRDGFDGAFAARFRRHN